jgi:hypothetical protein
MIRRLLVFVAMAALLPAIPSSVRAEEPLRSGTIVGGVGETPVSLYVRGMEGCVGAPTCAAWLQSACHPAVAGADPALHAAIVDVGDLADGLTERTLEFRPGPGLNWGRFIVQFWDRTYLAFSGRSEWCSELLASRMNNWERGTYRGYHWTFEIPRGAQWMTITSSPDNTNIRWELT